MEVYKTVVALEDYLWKKGKAFHMWSRRYYLVSGNCMYYYNNKDDVRPKGVIFLTGNLLQKIHKKWLGNVTFFLSLSNMTHEWLCLLDDLTRFDH
jgi:hypothetical protein